jgi:hypothetical protein
MLMRGSVLPSPDGAGTVAVALVAGADADGEPLGAGCDEGDGPAVSMITGTCVLYRT